MKLFVYVLLGITFAVAYLVFPPSHRKDENAVIAPSEALVEKFEKTIFQTEFGRYVPAALRWEGEVLIGVSGEKSIDYLPFIKDAAHGLCALTGRKVRVADLGAGFQIAPFIDNPTLLGPPRPNFFVFLTHSESLAQTLNFIPTAGKSLAKKPAQGFGTGGGLWGKRDRMDVAFVGVSDNYPESKVRNTLLEEITQGFGPVNDTEIVQPSIWSDKGPDVDRLPLNDQIILRALYDPAITPGMAKDAAMIEARRIIPELVEAVRRDGEKALYQRDDCQNLRKGERGQSPD